MEKGGKDIAMSKTKFNKTNHNIGWAAYSWSPVTGCKIGCDYCYARKMAERFGQSFEPTFHPERLKAPINTPVPNVGNNRVFVCSIGELFGSWIPDEWIERVFEVVRANSQWTFLFLTKCPERLPVLDWPQNTWIGATIDRQERVDAVTDAFNKIINTRTNLFVSCEPLLEDLELYPELMETLDWIIIGALSKGKTKVQPEAIWVENILNEARDYEIPVWMKDNLVFRLQELPE